MKKLIVTIVAVLCLLPIAVNAKSKVKVYIFEAGGCPACEAQMEYLQGLDSYNEKFEIVEKELYVDHVDWEDGKDYALGKKVAEAFLAADPVKFKDATYQATPFVVVSDVYAAAGYNSSLETVINEVYEDGDKDIVKCYEKGKTNCLDHLKEESSSGGSSVGVIITNIICVIVLLVTYLIKSSCDTNRVVEALSKRK
ncbi:MAG: hypothetical protein IKR74_04430 [Bacilli bacterium]|nr:hypothetical protein [Bacilli bacterium]